MEGSRKVDFRVTIRVTPLASSHSDSAIRERRHHLREAAKSTPGHEAAGSVLEKTFPGERVIACLSWNRDSQCVGWVAVG